ncbi:MAG TPA: SDR family NAD(P)-dependent oxidoreductase [Candidatus Acidoferrum sp.]
MKKAVILGATSGIAQQVQRLLIQEGVELLLVARSAEHLPMLAADLETRGVLKIATYTADLADISTHATVLARAQELLPDFDTVLLAYGTLLDQGKCQHSPQLAIREIDTNFVSAAALLTLFADYFEARKEGCIAAIASIAGDRGHRSNYVYGSAKGALGIFLEGLRDRFRQTDVRVITIKPGPVHTAMTDRFERNDKFADPQEVARDICSALQKRAPEILYTPAKWRYLAAAVRLWPDSLSGKIES